jgi:NitT/TauT family transport system ATP-binding protein
MFELTAGSSLEDYAVILEDVVFKYDRGDRILDEISCKILRKEFVTIMGPSGCGKTTLLYVFAGLREPISGRVIQQFSRSGLVHQEDGLLPWLTVEQNVEFPLWLTKSENSVTEARNQALTDVSALKFKHKLPHELSGGMKRRVEIARLIAAHTDLWLLDEPFEGLDFGSRQDLLRLLAYEARRRGASVVLVTHSIDDALASSDRIIVLGQNGKESGSITIPDSQDFRTLGDPIVDKYRLKVLQLLSSTKDSKQ